MKLKQFIKNSIIIFIMTLCLYSCQDIHKYNVHLNYTICYPDTSITYDTIMTCTYDKGFPTPKWQRIENFNVCLTSGKGTNYLKVYPGNNYIVATTAPIRLNTYKLLSDDNEK